MTEPRRTVTGRFTYDTVLPREISEGDLIWAGSPNPDNAGFARVLNVHKGRDGTGVYYKFRIEAHGHRTYRPKASVYRRVFEEG